MVPQSAKFGSRNYPAAHLGGCTTTIRPVVLPCPRFGFRTDFPQTASKIPGPYWRTGSSTVRIRFEGTSFNCCSIPLGQTISTVAAWLAPASPK